MTDPAAQVTPAQPEQTSTATASSPTYVEALAPGKLPTFWREEPQLWFVQAESIFASSRISSPIAKYHAIVAAADFHVLQHATDIVTQPVDSGSYERLKTRIITTFGQSEETKLRKLLTDMDLGDLRPSQLYQRMATLAKSKISDDALRTLWLQRLPLRTREILAVTHTSAITTVIEIADRLAEETIPQVAAATAIPTADLALQIAELTKQIAELKYGRSSSRSKPTRRRSVSSHRDRQPEICYFHRKFGESARSCRKPCAFGAKNISHAGNA